jgi:hypothetical protein
VTRQARAATPVRPVGEAEEYATCSFQINLTAVDPSYHTVGIFCSIICCLASKYLMLFKVEERLSTVYTGAVSRIWSVAGWKVEAPLHI